MNLVTVSYHNLRILYAMFVAISKCGLCHIDIQQKSLWTFANSGRFLGGQREGGMHEWIGNELWGDSLAFLFSCPSKEICPFRINKEKPTRKLDSVLILWLIKSCYLLIFFFFSSHLFFFRWYTLYFSK